MIASSSDYFNFCAKYSQLSSIPSSPERRFKSNSPCRRLFEDVSTNQNQVTSSPFVVSNGSSGPSQQKYLTTTNSFNNNNNNCSYFDNFEQVAVTKDEVCESSSLITQQQQQPQHLQLADILLSSYQRRRSIIFKTNNTDINSRSPFMDDLGFLSTSANSSKKPFTPEEPENYDNGNCIVDNSEIILMSSPTTKSIKKNNTIGHEKEQISCSIRKQHGQVHWNRRPHILARRSMSVTTDDRYCPTPSISENGLIHHLPCFNSPHDAIKRISPDTLVDLLEGKFAGVYDRLYIIDCRYPYEYEGGHIPSAINVNNPDVIEELLFENIKENTLIVFHCEFSSERAPRMALHVRNLDRQLNKSSYPSLHYPEMYILDGGYKNYWQQHGDKCDPPQAYLPMRNPNCRDQLKHHQKIKYAFKSGCHLSQHSTIKKLPPRSKKQERSKSLNIANARKFFDDLISSENTQNTNESDHDLSFNSGKRDESEGHMFPSYTIPMANSFSSIFASELDIPSEMDYD